MNKKRIYLAYIILGLGLFTTYIYLDLSFREQHDDWMNTPFSTVSPRYFDDFIVKFSITKTVDLPDTELYEVFSNVSNYSTILPKNVLNTKLLNVTNGISFYEITVMEKGIKANLQFSQEIEENRQYITMLTGDAKGTIVEQRFIAIDDSTTEIINAVELRLRGLLSPFLLIPEYNLKHAGNTVLDSFIDYTKLNTQSERIVDDLYRKILLRSADTNSLEYFSSQLEMGTITPKEIESILLESEEKKYLIHPNELKSMNELSPESKRIVDDLYRKILLRSADTVSFLYYSNLLEMGTITPKEIESILLESEEKKYLIPPNEIKTIDKLKPETVETIDLMYEEILNRTADPTGLQYYGNLLEREMITLDEIRLKLSGSVCTVEIFAGTECNDRGN